MTIFVDIISPKNNFVSYNIFSWKDIIPLSMRHYFLDSTENCYFLTLSLFQLSTYSGINLLPSQWSPSGPFSTLVPLLLCYFLELCSIIITYVKGLYKTYSYNYLNYVIIIENNQRKLIQLKDIQVGQLIVIPENSNIPVDGLAYSVMNDDHIKISIANLNGECNILCKDCISTLSDTVPENINIVHIKDHSHSIQQFDAIGIFDQTKFKLNNYHFIPGGSINYGNECVILVTQIGTKLRSYTSCEKDDGFQINFIDNHLTQSLTYIFLPLLGLYTGTLIYMSNYYNKILDWTTILKRFIQSWILLNGIVPFSAKVIVMTNRTIQSYIQSNSQVDYQSASAIDNFCTIPTMICDKTGTLTKNELLLTHMSYRDMIYHQDQFHSIPFDLLYCIIVGLHCKHNIYATEEDRIISEKLISMGAIVECSKNKVEIIKGDDTITIHILVQDELQFNCVRKLSSVIFYINSPENAFIITKGPLSKIEALLSSSEITTFTTVQNKYNIDYPYLRTIAFAVRSVTYDNSIDPFTYEISNKYIFCSILGIQDDIQPQIIQTISNLQNYGKRISICTGDRYETAMYIADQIGILCENQIMLQETPPEGPNTKLLQTTFIFNSNDIRLSMLDYDTFVQFKYYLLHSSNCVAYSLIPKDKKFITTLFEGNNRNCITVGDGTNDIPMLKTSTLSIGVQNDNNLNVVNVSHITIRKFSDMCKIYKDSLKCHNINYNSIYGIFYKTILLNTLVYLYIIYNNYNLCNVLFNFIDIQGFHLLWGLFPILGLNFITYTPDTFASIRHIIKTALIIGIINTAFIYILSIILPFNTQLSILLLAIISINIQFIIFYGNHKLNIVLCLISITLGLLYVFAFRHIIPDIF
jgi:magnesium-transporting ATPase (P-type)